MKKIISLFVAVLVLLTAGVPAFAVTTTGNITIKNTTANTGITLKDEVYNAYKVMDLVQGANGNPQKYTVDSRFEKFFKDKANSATPPVSVDTADKVNDFANKYLNDNVNNMNEVARDIKTYVDSNSIKENGDGGVTTSNALEQTATIANLPLGYYIIVDKTTASTEHVIAAAALGTNYPELVIELKASKPTLDKQIYHNESKSWGKVGDNQIGDNVEFRLIGKLPNNITGYKNYTYIMHDTLDKGLTFNNNIEVYVGETKDISKKLVLDTDYTIEKNVSHEHKNSNSLLPGKTRFDINIKVKEGIDSSKFKLGDTLYVYYTAKLNENALTAGLSNDNSVYLEYSNNPYNETSKEKGPEIIVKDYTFKLNGLKTDAQGKELQGAEFNVLIGDKAILFKLVSGTNDYIVSTDGTGTATIVSGANGKFNIVGLDDSVEYTLRETKAPLGYNSISDKKFTITAGYDGNGQINLLSTNGDGITKVGETFELGTTIVNTKANLLPGTGGIGTTLFSLVGGSLMIMAFGLFVFKKRKKVA